MAVILRNFRGPKLSFAEITHCGNYHVLERSCSWTILCTSYPLQELFLASNHFFHFSSFGSCKFWAPCACPLVWAKKSPYHCSTHEKNEKYIELIFQKNQILSDILE
jgi:hypothetical protein